MAKYIFEITLKYILPFNVFVFTFTPMIPIKGYTALAYPDFQKMFAEAFAKSGLSALDIAYKIRVKSATTVESCFRPRKIPVSDQNMTLVMKELGFPGFIVWHSGEKYYYVKQ